MWNPSSTLLVIARPKLISGALCDSPLLSFPPIQMLSFGSSMNSLSIMPTYSPLGCGGLGETINVHYYNLRLPTCHESSQSIIHFQFLLFYFLLLRPLLLRIFGFNQILLTIVTPLLLLMVDV